MGRVIASILMLVLSLAVAAFLTLPVIWLYLTTIRDFWFQ